MHVQHPVTIDPVIQSTSVSGPQVAQVSGSSLVPDNKTLPHLRPLESTLAILLTLVTGYRDAIGLFRLNGIYVANMSGNSVAIGIHSAQGAWPSVPQRLLPVVCYVGALFSMRILVNAAGILRIRRVVAASLVTEIIFLLLFADSA